MKKVLLVALAHPDDESFGMGGTLAYYSSLGVEVHLLCATKGEVGEVTSDQLNGFDTIANLRVSELRCAASYLGIKEVHFLGYRDSGMQGSPDNINPQALAFQPIDEVAGLIVEYIRDLKPQVVLTFDPIGGYRHPDHIAIHKATVRAFEFAGDKSFRGSLLEPYVPEKLYFHTFQRGFLRTAVKLLKIFGKNPRKLGKNQDIDLESFANEDFPIHAVINIRKFHAQKEQAGRCHESQGGGRMGGGILNQMMRIFDNSESFMQAYPPIRTVTKKDHDLFGDKNRNL
jgi:N-acetyl-1-D-myo-inositol-2-amino-2-deoxy-alpha-D-glucopyranoside deacetylase